MKKKVINGVICTTVGIAFVGVGAFFALQSFGTAMLNNTPKLGLIFLCAAPVLLLVGMITTLVGTGKAVKNYKKSPKTKKSKEATSSIANIANGKFSSASVPNKTSFVFCGKCGTRNNATDVFCGKCGEKMT